MMIQALHNSASFTSLMMSVIKIIHPRSLHDSLLIKTNLATVYLCCSLKSLLDCLVHSAFLTESLDFVSLLAEHLFVPVLCF